MSTQTSSKPNAHPATTGRTEQIESGIDLGDGQPNDEILRAAGVKRIHGVRLDCSTVVNAKHNRNGEVAA